MFAKDNRQLLSNKISINLLMLVHVIINSIYVYFMSNLENMYFLLLSVIQLLTLGPLPREWSPTGPYSTFIPLMICLGMEVAIEIYKWCVKYKNAYFSNVELYKCLKVPKHSVFKMSKDIYPGCVMIFKRGDIVPVDGVLVGVAGKCRYALIDMSMITGETRYNKLFIPGDLNWSKMATMVMIGNKCKYISGKNGKKYPIVSSNIIVNGSKVISDNIMMWVTACGSDRVNACSVNDRNKISSLIDSENGKYMLEVNMRVLALIILITSCIKVYFSANHSSLIANIVQCWIVFNGLMPFSVKMVLIFVRFLEAFIVNNSNDGIKFNAADKVDDISTSDTIISDKTGTLTKNNLVLSHVHSSIASKITSLDDEKYNMSDNIGFIKALTLCVHYNGGHYDTGEDKAIDSRLSDMGINVERNTSELTIRIDGSSYKYELFHNCGLEFNHECKSSSVIVHDLTDNRYYIYTKGAVSFIKDKIKHCIGDLEKSETLFTRQYPGCRLIAYGYRELQEKDIRKLTRQIGKRQRSILEDKLRYLGMVGLEDEIGDFVPETISYLSSRSLSVSVCTGDRITTTIAAAKQAGIIKDIKDIVLISNDENINILGRTIIFNSNELRHNKNISSYIRSAKNFIACELHPDDKAFIVSELAKSGRRTLTIGDGYNDIKMFKESNISVAINRDKRVSDQADAHVNKFKNIRELFEKIGDHTYHTNSIISYFGFSRCFMVISILFLLNIIAYNKPTYSIFNGFVLKGFSTFWTLLHIIHYTLYFRSQKKHIINTNIYSKLSHTWNILGTTMGILISIIFYSDSHVIVGFITILCINLTLFYTRKNSNIINIICAFSGTLVYLLYVTYTHEVLDIETNIIMLFKIITIVTIQKFLYTSKLMHITYLSS